MLSEKQQKRINLLNKIEYINANIYDVGMDELTEKNPKINELGKILGFSHLIGGYDTINWIETFKEYGTEIEQIYQYFKEIGV